MPLDQISANCEGTVDACVQCAFLCPLPLPIPLPHNDHTTHFPLARRTSPHRHDKHPTPKFRLNLRKPEPSDIPETPANSTRRGSFNYDREKRSYPMEWPSLAAFDAWRRNEELAHSVEFIASSSARPTIIEEGPMLWTMRRVYVCSRQPKYPDREQIQKIGSGSKKTGCRFRVVIKLYPHTETVLGRCTRTHNHEIDVDNVPHTRQQGAAKSPSN